PIISSGMMAELRRTLKKPKITKLIAENKIEEFLKYLDAASRRIEPAKLLKVCRDPSDDMFISLSVTVSAPVISLDNDLLVLAHQFDILHPKEFIKRLKKAV